MGLRDDSRKSYAKREFTITQEEIKVGALQRIADATEVISKNYTDLLKEKERYSDLVDTRNKSIETLNRRISALQGVITRQSNQIKRLKNGSH